MSPKSRVCPVKPQWEGGVFRQISRPCDKLKLSLHIHFIKFTEILIHLYRLRVGGLFSVILI